MTTRQYGRNFLPFFLCLCLLLGGCSPHDSSTVPSAPSIPDTGSAAEQTKGSRDNSARVLSPSADGKDIYKCDAATVDASNVSEGYLIAAYKGKNKKVKLQITGPDQVTYTYNLHGGSEVFPLPAGDGAYKTEILENITGTKYAAILSENIPVKLSSQFGPYLYPNQYVNFNEKSLAVAEAVRLSEPANSDLDVVSAVYSYIISNFTYDYEKSAEVSSGYLPDVDTVFQAKSGICFDYASVMATMLRSQGIPTRLEVGYMGEEYHAWLSIHIRDSGWINGIIEFDGKNWELLDPTFAATSSSPKDFIPENSKYITKYVY